MTSTRSSIEILESSHLEVVIPANTNSINFAKGLEATAANREESDSSSEALSRIPQRNSLFYDEIVPIFILLALNLLPTEDSQVQFYLSRLIISIEVVAIDGQRKKEDGSTSNKPNEGIHVLHSKTLDNNEISWKLIAHNERMMAFLKLDIPLGHPRVRLVNPRVVFMASAKLRPVELPNPQLGDDYIPNRQDFGVNLLEPFNNDPSIAPFRPHLSALSVSRVAPASKGIHEIPSTLIYRSKNLIHIYPAINVRLRHSQIITGNKHSIIASLDVEVTTYGECDVLIEKVELNMIGGKSEQIESHYAPILPITCHPRDEVTFLYSLEPLDQTTLALPSLSNSTIKPVTVKLQATALLSEECHALIRTDWNTVIDLAIPGLSGEQSSRGSRVLTAHGSLSTTTFSSSSLATFDPSRDQSLELQFPVQTPEFSAESAGLTVTFSGPPKVYVGEVFSWDVFVVNRSPRVRKLALVVPQKRWKGGDIGKSALSQAPNEWTEHVVEDAVLHSLHRSQYLEPAELVCLMNDVRIGPLPPSACHTTELKFIALSAGILNLDSIRIIDFSLPSNETTECRDLPSIIAVTR